MSEKRRDHRGRILHNGEIQLSDGRYRFKYVDEMGKERCVYSWRLDYNDATPKGKRRTSSLREMEKKIQADHFEQIATNGGNMTVLELVEKYTSTKTGVRPTTVAGYGTVINLLKKDPFGKRRIDRVRISDAKCWLIHLQQVEKKSYSSIHSIRGVLRPAFQLAVDDDLIRKNPFQFQLMEVVVNDSVTREAISRAEERKFLRFVKEDPHFCRYYEGIYNRTIHTTPEILDVDKIMPLPAHNGLYQSLLAMKYLKPSDEEWMSFVDEFDKLIQKNNSIISITAMNLPTDWKAHLSV